MWDAGEIGRSISDRSERELARPELHAGDGLAKRSRVLFLTTADQRRRAPDQPPLPNGSRKMHNEPQCAMRERDRAGIDTFLTVI